MSRAAHAYTGRRTVHATGPAWIMRSLQLDAPMPPPITGFRQVYLALID